MKQLILVIASLISLTISAFSQFTTDASQLERHVYILASDSLLGRGFGTPEGLKAANYLAGEFRKAGIEPLDGHYLHPFIARKGILNIPGNNVVGVIRGNDPVLKDEYIVLGAHYDHLGWKVVDGDTVVYNGADDNATGSASIIEIGRNLVSEKENLGRSVILVAFDGEESGLIGSRHFLKDSTVMPHDVKLMFSLDMVGMAEAHKGVDLKGIALLDDSDYLVGELAAKYDLNITKVNRSIEQRTDTAPFGDKGIPAVAVYTGSESPYHKPEDTAEKLDYEGTATIVNYMSDAVLRLSNQQQMSAWTGPEEGEGWSDIQHFRAGIRLNVGSGLHNYRDRFYKGKTIFASSAGVAGAIRLGTHLDLMPEVLYETKGSEHADGIFRTHSISTPLTIRLLTTEEEDVRMYWQAGGYYSYHFGGSISGTPIDFDDEYHAHEYGLSFGLGFEIISKMQIGFYFQKGLSDLNRLPDDRISHENVYFQLGYFF